MGVRALAEIDLSSIAHNVRLLRLLAPEGDLVAVVKARGYGHGAAQVAQVAIDAGARMLAVAQVNEGMALRDAGISAPILILSEPDITEFDECVDFNLQPTLYTEPAIAAAAREGAGRLVTHLKVDTGMRRVGASPDDALARTRAIVDAGLELASVWTHLAAADEPGNPFTDEQLDRFDDVRAALDAAGLHPPLAHAANSAATMVVPRARMDLNRCGIALYGIAPAPALEGLVDLQPALSLVSNVSFVKRVRPGDRISYGLRHEFDYETNVATVPIGYADGVRRRLGLSGGTVLIGGRHRQMVGVVTMDQLMVDCGDDKVHEGDEVVLIGRQGQADITAQDWANRLDTIAYEIVCGVGDRVTRSYVPGP